MVSNQFDHGGEKKKNEKRQIVLYIISIITLRMYYQLVSTFKLPLKEIKGISLRNTGRGQETQLST